MWWVVSAENLAVVDMEPADDSAFQRQQML